MGVLSNGEIHHFFPVILQQVIEEIFAAVIFFSMPLNPKFADS